MTDLMNNEIETTENMSIDEEMAVEMPPQRVNPFCVISKDSVKVKDIDGKMHDLHMIETNSSWSSNPYGEAYAVVPDDMVLAIQETNGFVDIVLSEDGTEVISFEPLEKPEIPVQEPQPTAEQKRIAELESELATLSSICSDLLYTQALSEMG